MDEIVFQIIKNCIPPLANLLFRIFGLGYKKKNLWIGLLTFAIMMFGVQFALIYFLGYRTFSTYSVLLFTLTTVAVALIITRDNLKETLFYVFVSTNAVFYLTIVCNAIRHLANLNYWQLALVEAGVFLPILLLSIRFFARPFRFMAEQLKTGWVEAFLAPVCVLGAGIIVTTYSGAYFGDNPLTNLIVITLIEGSYFLFLISLYKNLLVIYEASNERLNRHLLKAEMESYETQLEEAKVYRHDLKFHNSLLKEMLDKNDIERAKKYLSEYSSALASTKKETYCENPVVDALLRMYARKYASKGVSFLISVSVSSSISVPSPALGSILSNLLENAYEATKSLGEEYQPEVSFKAKDNADSLIVEVRNTSPQRKTLASDGMPLTTKHGGGTGLRSVKSAVNKEKGDIRIEQKDNEFIVQIIIPLKEKPKATEEK